MTDRKTFYLSMCMYKCACTVEMGPKQKIVVACFLHVNFFLNVLEKQHLSLKLSSV